MLEHFPGKQCIKRKSNSLNCNENPHMYIQVLTISKSLSNYS